MVLFDSGCYGIINGKPIRTGNSSPTSRMSLNRDQYKSKENRLGKYYFTNTEYNIARIEYKNKWNIPPSPFDKILVSLESEFKSLQELRHAESIIEDKIQNFINLYSA